jgi:hypothetical protein
MIPVTENLTVRTGAGSVINAVSGLSFTSDDRMLIATESVMLISE